MAGSTKWLNCAKCRYCKRPLTAKLHPRSLFMNHNSRAASWFTLSRMLSSVFWDESNLPFRISLQQTARNSSSNLAALPENENELLLKRKPSYFNLLIRVEGLNDKVLDEFFQFVKSGSKKMNLKVKKRGNLTPTDFKHNQILDRPLDSYKKHRATFHLPRNGRISLFFRFNLTAEHFNHTVAQPLDSYKKLRKTYHFNKRGLILQVGKISFEKSYAFIKHVQEKEPKGISVQMELVRNEPLHSCSSILQSIFFSSTKVYSAISFY